MHYAKIETEDVALEIEYWQSAVICPVLGANPPLEVVEGFFRRIWKTLAIDKICLVKRGVFLVRFTNLGDQLSVVQKGVYYFDKKPVIVRAWNPKLDLNTEVIVSLPF